MDQLTITDAIASMTEAMGRVESHAGETFRERAERFIVDYLKAHRPTPGETLTSACVAAGISPHDDRAFGAVYMVLSRRGVIEKCGMVPRIKGHMTSGGNVWRLKTGGNA